MRVLFHGAAGMVTGSMHLVEAAGKRVLLDCGMLQGGRDTEARNSEAFPFDVGTLDALVVSHAHIDHIGRIPLLVARGFRGPIYAQQATADLMPIMLLDSASLQESEAARNNRDLAPGQPEAVPLYTKQDVQAAMGQVRPPPTCCSWSRPTATATIAIASRPWPSSAGSSTLPGASAATC